MSLSIYSELWMGRLERYMDHEFLSAAFRKVGENPLQIRLMRNKETGGPANFCFVDFASGDDAFSVMQKLNGRPIPGTNPIVRFCLNIASCSHKGQQDNYSVWVGDLSPDVDDFQLYRVFCQRFLTINSAKVIRDSSGFSRGYGFVRFGVENEQKLALKEMKGYIGLGSKPLQINYALPKANREPAVSASSAYGYGETSSNITSPALAQRAEALSAQRNAQYEPIALQQQSNAIAAAGADRVDWTLADHIFGYW